MSDARLPKPGDLVIVQITKILQFGAYCKLLEYDNLDAFLPIKEISSGWIKNIHEFIREGQKIVCKITFVDHAKNTFDVSLKKVTPKESKDKINVYNFEKRSEGLLQQALKKAKLTPQKDEIINTIKQEFGNISGLIYYINDVPEEFKKSKSLPQKLKDQITELIAASKKEKKHEVSYIMTLSTYNTTSGASEIRSILNTIAESGIAVSYVSAPKYRVSAEDMDYVKAEQKIKTIDKIVKSKLSKGTYEMEKEKVKKEKEDILSKNI
jgi:translation initiation factor 2 subunit 1